MLVKGFGYRYNGFMTTVRLHRLLTAKTQTVATAESCTGGLLAASFTSLGGASAYFLLGMVCYSNAAKTSLLGILPEHISRYGAVSDHIAREMAASVRELAKSDWGIGITGIAGPCGGSPEKPVGTVFIAVSGRKTTLSRHFLFKGSRAGVRQQSVDQALCMLTSLLGK
jgi:PncC family amidohydrolase